MRQSFVQSLVPKSSPTMLDSDKFNQAISHNFISGFSDTFEVFEIICSRAAVIMNVQTCLLYILNQNTLQLETFVKDSDGKEMRLSKPVDRGITGSVLLKERFVSLSDPASKSSQWSADIDNLDGLETKSYLACPLWDSTSSSCIGVLEFRNKLNINKQTEFLAADEQLGQIIAFQVSQAVLHSRHQYILNVKNQAINLVCVKQYDANDSINIDDETDSKSSKSLTSLSSATTSTTQRQKSANSLCTAWKWKPPPAYDKLSERDWSYDVFSKSEEELIMHAVDIFDERGLFSNFSIQVNTFVNFMKEIKNGYNISAPYHSHYHAFDVMHVCYLFITRCRADDFLDSFNILSLLIGALAHDLGHDGFNNSFHCTTNSELAVIYNGISILENYSAAFLFRILRKDNCNIFARLSESDFNKLKSRLIDMILDTDAKNHFTLMTRFKHAIETKQLSRGLLSSILLHVSDVSNPTRPGPIARKWAFAVQEEFFRQGDKEKELNLPLSPFMDRECENLPRMQVTFIDALVTPVFTLLEDLLPLVNDQCLKQLQKNRSFWCSMQDKSISTTGNINAYLKGMKEAVDDPKQEVKNLITPVQDIVQADSEAPIPGIPANVVKTNTEPNKRKMSLIPINRNEVIDFSVLEEGVWIKNGDVPIKLKKSLTSHLSTCFKNSKGLVIMALQSSIFQSVILFATMYSLFANDLNLILGNKSSDPIIDVATFLVMLLFTCEIFASLYCVQQYIHFFFWLDLASVVSLVFEIGFLLPLEESSTGTLGLARASRAAKVGARAGRLAKLFRLVRLIKITKLLKWTIEWRKSKDKLKKNEIVTSDEDVDMKMSVVGRKMTESITKKVILTVMLMLVVFSLLETESIQDGRQLQLDAMGLYPNSTILKDVFFCSHSTIISLKGVGDEFMDESKINQLRTIEIVTLVASTNDSVVASFDASSDVHNSAIFSILTTICVCCILAFLSLLFSKDAYEIMIRPIEKMKLNIQKLSENPLLMFESNHTSINNKLDSIETNFLDCAIKKMADLLQIGFGTAGAEIIAKNFNLEGELDPMIPGIRIHAIFGFCEIREFNKATEYLQEDVIVFVNKLAKIAHDHVMATGGHPSKNIGNHFILVWRLNTSKDGNRDRLEKITFDSALNCIQNIISDLEDIGSIAKFSQTTLLNRSMKASMGFGLHSGWAIEGSVGSKVMIEAAYISPHMDLVSQLESVTEAYNVPLLMSSAFVSGLSGSLQASCRRVDRILLNGCTEEIIIFHQDMKPFKSFNEKPSDYNDLILATSWQNKEEVIRSGINITDLLKSLQSDKTLLIKEVYDAAFNAYLDGDWKKCKIVLHLWFEKFPGDPLVQNLIRKMRRYDFTCPGYWNNDTKRFE